MADVIPSAGREPGIYLSLPADEYHADPALGSTAIDKLHSHAVEFFNFWPGNPQREIEEDTPAMVQGRAVHALVLEGEKELLRRYAPEPEGDDVLRTMEDMKRLLRPLGFELTGTKDQLIKRVQAAAPKARIYDVLMEDARAKAKGILKPKAWARVLKAGAHVSMHPQISQAFQGGRKEVSIFWINDFGIRCRARLDCLRVITAGEAAELGDDISKTSLMAVIADLKSFANPRNIPVVRAVKNATGENVKQAVHYMDGFIAMQKMLRAHGASAVLDATPNDARWLELVAKATSLRFYFVFWKSTGAPYAHAVWHEPRDRLTDVARHSYRDCMASFRRYYDHFGVSDLWVNLDEPEHLYDETDIKPWYL